MRQPLETWFFAVMFCVATSLTGCDSADDEPHVAPEAVETPSSQGEDGPPSAATGHVSQPQQAAAGLQQAALETLRAQQVTALGMQGNARALQEAALNSAEGITAQIPLHAIQLQQAGLEVQTDLLQAAQQLQAATLEEHQAAVEAAGALQAGLAQQALALHQMAGDTEAQLEAITAAGAQQLGVAQAQLLAQLREAQGTYGALGADLTGRPVCQRLMDCCQVYGTITAAQGMAALGEVAVQSCQTAAQLGNDAACAEVIAATRREAESGGVTPPASCAAAD